MRETYEQVGVLSLVFISACSVPEIDPPMLTNSETGEGGSEEVGAANETTGAMEGEEIGPHACLIDPDDGYGFRHHCGGRMYFGFNGLLGDEEFARSYGFGFGPGYADDEFLGVDTYAQPAVAACCGGPYDFDQAPSTQSTHFINCKMDAVQQMCASMPAWLIELGQENPLFADSLYDLAAQLGDGDVQKQCILSLFENNGLFNEINDTSWSIETENAALNIEVDLVEILDIAYDAPPLECSSIFENDEFLLPLVKPMAEGGELEILELDSGGLELHDDANFARALVPPEGHMAVATLASGELELRNLVLRETSPTTILIDSLAHSVDSWNLALTGPVSQLPQQGVVRFPAGSVTFTLSASYAGSLYRASGTNQVPLVLSPSPRGGWALEQLELTLEDAASWTLASQSPLHFSPW